MTIISPDEYTLLMSLSGNEQNLQAANIGKKYGLGAGQILNMLPNQVKSPVSQSSEIAPNNQATVDTNISVQNRHRFEYDPSPDASQRRQQVSQAITCPSCGAALGIPAIRPIKVTCPQCLEEHTFQS
jgi:formylmethanofuran dehydrogenase subunit E